MHERKDIENELAQFIRRELIGGRRDDEDFQLNAEDDLLTSGLVEAGCRSATTDQERHETPHLNLSYTAPKKSLFARS